MSNNHLSASVQIEEVAHEKQWIYIFMALLELVQNY